MISLHTMGFGDWGWRVSQDSGRLESLSQYLPVALRP